MDTGINFSTLSFLAALAFLPSTLCYAETKELIHITKETEEKIISDYVEHHKWCDSPIPKAEEGEVLIYWTRDENGKCLKQNLVVGE